MAGKDYNEAWGNIFCVGYVDYLEYEGISQVYTYVKVYQITHFEHVWFFAFQLSFNKVVLKKHRSNLNIIPFSAAPSSIKSQSDNIKKKQAHLSY